MQYEFNNYVTVESVELQFAFTEHIFSNCKVTVKEVHLSGFISQNCPYRHFLLFFRNIFPLNTLLIAYLCPHKMFTDTIRPRL